MLLFSACIWIHFHYFSCKAIQFFPAIPPSTVRGRAREWCGWTESNCVLYESMAFTEVNWLENQTNDVDWKWIELNKYQQKRCCRCMRAQRASQYTIATKKMTKKKTHTNTNETKRSKSHPKKSVNRDECVMCEVSKKSPVRKASMPLGCFVEVYTLKSHMFELCALITRKWT